MHSLLSRQLCFHQFVTCYPFNTPFPSCQPHCLTWHHNNSPRLSPSNDHVNVHAFPFVSFRIQLPVSQVSSPGHLKSTLPTNTSTTPHLHTQCHSTHVTPDMTFTLQPPTFHINYINYINYINIISHLIYCPYLFNSTGHSTVKVKPQSGISVQPMAWLTQLPLVGQPCLHAHTSSPGELCLALSCHFSSTHILCFIHTHNNSRTPT